MTVTRTIRIEPDENDPNGTLLAIYRGQRVGKIVVVADSDWCHDNDGDGGEKSFRDLATEDSRTHRRNGGSRMDGGSSPVEREKASHRVRLGGIRF